MVWWLPSCHKFYDNSILLGTKIPKGNYGIGVPFYDNSILLGTKIHHAVKWVDDWFYDNSILLGTKMVYDLEPILSSFTITQFF